jgi:YD repeat-containing protein
MLIHLAFLWLDSKRCSMKRGAWIAFAIAILTSVASVLAGMSANASETVKYTYDSRGRLVKVERSGRVNNNVRADYSYDKGDNRTNVNVLSPNSPPQ